MRRAEAGGVHLPPPPPAGRRARADGYATKHAWAKGATARCATRRRAGRSRTGPTGRPAGRWPYGARHSGCGARDDALPFRFPLAQQFRFALAPQSSALAPQSRSALAPQPPRTNSVLGCRACGHPQRHPAGSAARPRQGRHASLATVAPPHRRWAARLYRPCRSRVGCHAGRAAAWQLHDAPINPQSSRGGDAGGLAGSGELREMCFLSSTQCPPPPRTRPSQGITLPQATRLHGALSICLATGLRGHAKAQRSVSAIAVVWLRALAATHVFSAPRLLVQPDQAHRVPLLCAHRREHSWSSLARYFIRPVNEFLCRGL